MNHSRQSPKLVYQPSEPAPFEVESGSFSSVPHDTAHSLFVPLHYEPGYRYPLIVWLHGLGGDERQLMRIMPLVSMRNYVAIAPRGLLMKRAGNAGSETYGWDRSDGHELLAEQRVFDCIEIASRRFHVAADRIFLAGFDCGGTMALRVAMNHPSKFAGVLSLGGAFPTGRAPLARLPEARQLPVFLAAGRRSTSYTEVDVCADLRLLHTAGLSITLRLYPCGQELSPQMLSDIDRWIIDQITGPTAASNCQWLTESEGGQSKSA